MSNEQLIRAASLAIALVESIDREYASNAALRMAKMAMVLCGERANSNRHREAVGEIKRLAKQVNEFRAERLAKAGTSHL